MHLSYPVVPPKYITEFDNLHIRRYFPILQILDVGQSYVDPCSKRVPYAFGLE